MKFFSFIGSLIDRLCVVAGAFIGSQVPLFMQQYTQRLAGHVEALQKLINQLHQIASISQKNLDQYIQKFRESSDPDFHRQGDFMQGIAVRLQELQQALEHLTQHSFWLRPYYFFKDLQPDIVRSTLDSFQPGFNLTIEGLCYAGGGMILGWVFYQTISKCLKKGMACVIHS